MATEVNLSVVETWLEDFFGNRANSKFNFLPAELLEWAKSSNVNIVTADVPRWDEFEKGVIDWGKE
jgi:hypothetical protein